ncbi:hypothetical protein MKX73_13985 [Solibacillus sp. FSL W7-1436]|uniref:hypothetical protein n=1 Tax=Solibacillus sp. FSL W7-1436 TaxID=2921705 RepID=UPI0030F8B786
MKRVSSKIGILILFSIILLSACIQKDYTFFGESENWRVQYTVTDDSGCNSTKGYIKYLGNDPMPEQLEFSVDNTEGASVSLDENGMFFLPYGCSNATEGSELKAKIKWNNQSETIQLPLK